MNHLIIDPAANPAFAEAYPDRPCPVVHDLQNHPLFSREALAQLAGRLPTSHIEHALGNVSVNQNPSNTKTASLTPAQIVRGIDENGCWMVMKKVETDPAYAALLRQCLEGIAPIIGSRTGAHIRSEAFVFVSAPNSVTPFHMDPEHNILLQIAGTKTMNVYPNDAPELVPQQAHEAFHRGAHRNLPHRPEFEALAQPFVLTPGVAIYVPVKAPHWVQNGPGPSISFSITWRSAVSDNDARVHRVNHRLRRLGLNPARPGASPLADQSKVAAHKGLKGLTGLGRSLLGKQRDRQAY